MIDLESPETLKRIVAVAEAAVAATVGKFDDIKSSRSADPALEYYMRVTALHVAILCTIEGTGMPEHAQALCLQLAAEIYLRTQVVTVSDQGKD